MESLVIKFLEMSGVVLAVVQFIKRAIPDKYRGIANPILAVLVGIVYAYLDGGAEGIRQVLLLGVGTGVTAIVGYKVPKKGQEKLKGMYKVYNK